MIVVAVELLASGMVKLVAGQLMVVLVESKVDVTQLSAALIGEIAIDPVV